jgi:hypothetical protein
MDVSWKRIYVETSRKLVEPDLIIAKRPHVNAVTKTMPSLRWFYRMKFLSEKYRLFVDTIEAYKFDESSYFNYGAFFLAFERLNIYRNDKDTLVFDGIDEEIIPDVDELIHSAFYVPLRTSMVITSGSSFPKYLRARINIGNALMDVFEKAKSLGIEVNKEDEFTLISHTGQYLDDSNPKDAARKLALKQKCLDFIGLKPISNRVRHYNTACTHFQFNDMEEGFKWLRWTFNYYDGVYAVLWTRRSFFNSVTTKQLFDGLSYDEDFSSVRERPEFKEVFDLAKKAVEDEEVKATMAALESAVPKYVDKPILNSYLSSSEDASGSGNDDTASDEEEDDLNAMTFDDEDLVGDEGI